MVRYLYQDSRKLDNRFRVIFPGLPEFRRWLSIPLRRAATKFGEPNSRSAAASLKTPERIARPSSQHTFPPFVIGLHLTRNLIRLFAPAGAHAGAAGTRSRMVGDRMLAKTVGTPRPQPSGSGMGSVPGFRRVAGGDNPGHVVIVPDQLLAPITKAGLAVVIAGEG